MRLIVCALAALLLTACNPQYALAPAALQASVAREPAGGEAFAYSHSLQLEMDRVSIMSRFERTRDSCLQDQTLSCTVLSSSARIQEGSIYSSSDALLLLLLPHDTVATFEQRLLQPLDGEAQDSIKVRSRSTDMGNVTTESADTDQRLLQLTDYRDRLSALMNRRDASVDELIKLANELSSAQGNVEQFAAKKRDVTQRIAKDRLAISFSERPRATDAMLPLALAWGAGLQTLSESAAAALSFVIAIIPWLPIVALTFVILRRLWRAMRKKSPAATAW